VQNFTTLPLVARTLYFRLDIGFVLLSCNNSLSKQLSDGIEEVSDASQKDGVNHDVTLLLNQGTGITIHCNQDAHEIAYLKLSLHCYTVERENTLTRHING
jgi:hypothetical protein